MLHNDMAQLVIAEVVGSGGLRAHRHHDAVRVVEGLEVVVRVGDAVAGVGRRLSQAGRGVGELALAQVGQLDGDELVAAQGRAAAERLDGAVEGGAHVRVGEGDPFGAEAEVFLGRGRGGDRRGERGLRWVRRVGLGHDPVGDGQVGWVRAHGADDAHG